MMAGLFLPALLVTLSIVMVLFLSCLVVMPLQVRDRRRPAPCGPLRPDAHAARRPRRPARFGVLQTEHWSASWTCPRRHLSPCLLAPSSRARAQRSHRAPAQAAPVMNCL